MASSTLALYNHHHFIHPYHPTLLPENRDQENLPLFAALDIPFFGETNSLNQEEEEEPSHYDNHDDGRGDNSPLGYGFIHQWQESFFSAADDLDGNLENHHQSQNPDKEEETHQNSYPSPLLGFGSWSETVSEKEYEYPTGQYYEHQEQGDSTNELQLYESIFGYWPCLSREGLNIFEQLS